MALSNNTKELIEAVSNNNIFLAKRCALAVIGNDTAEKNAQWRERVRDKLLNDGNSAFSVPPNLKSLIYCEDTTETFDETRYYLTEREKALYEHILKAEKVSERLQEMKIRYLNSALLYGDSGTGKTLFGRYIAYKLNIPFFYLKLSGIIDSLMGQSAKNITHIFEYVRQIPCVLMLDELDSISYRRSSDTSSPDKEMSRTTITIMQEIDKLPNTVVLLGATNRLDVIDEAVIRRFSKTHEVKTLNADEKAAFVRQFLNAINMTLSDLDFDEIVKSSDNQSKLISATIEKITNIFFNETA